ncbi:MAG: hypothetical protein ABI605_10805 [Rhizobacter sp.]
MPVARSAATIAKDKARSKCYYHEVVRGGGVELERHRAASRACRSRYYHGVQAPFERRRRLMAMANPERVNGYKARVEKLAPGYTPGSAHELAAVRASVLRDINNLR